MKKMYFFAKRMFAVLFVVVTTVSLLSSCNKYDDDIKDLNDRINQIANSVNDLKTKLGDNPVTGISFDEKTGKMIVTTPSGTVTYTIAAATMDVKLDNNTLYVNGENKGSVVFPESSLVTVGADGFLYINGVKTGIQTSEKITGKAEVKEDGYLYVDGQKTDICIPPVVEVRNGVLFINGQEQRIEFPKDVIVFNKDEKNNIISVTLAQDGSNYTIVSGTEVAPLAGLAFVPDFIINGVNSIPFGYLMNNNEVVMVSVPNATFRLNPTKADISKATWKMLNRAATIVTRASEEDKYDLVSLSNKAVNNGMISFDLTLNNLPKTGDLRDIIALEATVPAPKGETAKVVSDYIQVQADKYTAFIGNKKAYLEAVAPKAIPTFDLQTDKSKITEWNGSAPKIAADAKAVQNSSFDLMDYVMASAELAVGGGTRSFFEQLDFNNYTCRFSKVSYKGPDGVTDQAYFVNLEGSKVTVTQGTSAIGRYPVFMVEVMNGTNVVTTAYIKYEIVSGVDKTYNVTPKDFDYKQLYAVSGTPQTNDIVISWIEMNKIYAGMGLTHTQFQNIYGALTPVVTYSSNIQAANVEFVKSANQPNIDTYAMYLRVKPTTKFGNHTVTYSFEPTDGNPKFKVVFTLSVKSPVAPVLSDIYAPNGVAETKGKFVGGKYKMQMTLKEAFKNYMTDYTAQFGVATNLKIDNANHLFAFKFPTDNSLNGAVLSTNGMAGEVTPFAKIEEVGGTGFETQDIAMENPLTTDSKTYHVIFRTVFENGESINVSFSVKFNNPFTVTLDPMAMLTKTDPTTLNVNEYFNVMIADKPLYDFSKKSTTGYDANGYHTANCTAYGIAVDGSMLSYALFTTPVTGGNLTITGPTLTWDNKGADLFADITSEMVTAKISTTYAERITPKTVVTLKKNK